MATREFIDLGGYPQFSLRASGEWSDPIAGGVGCNFFLGRSGNLPPFSDSVKWRRIDDAIRDLHIGMLRVGFLPPRSGDICGDTLAMSPWDEETQTYDRNAEFFLILRHLNDLAAELGFPIMIDPWWTPASLQVPMVSAKGRGAPADPEQYATRYVLPLIETAISLHGCRNIRYLGLFNEPIWNQNDRNPDNFAVPNGVDQLVRLTECYAAVRTALDAGGFEKVAIVGPSALCGYQFPMADFLASGCDPTPYLGALDHHVYLYHNDNLKAPNTDFFSTHEMVDGTVRRWCDFARRKKMPFMITEMGSFAYGRMFWGERDMEGPASHTCAISDADFIVRALAHGTQTFLRWAFSVPAHYDGRWSLVEWDTEGVRPTPNIYPLYRELMRAIRPGCRVMKVNIGQAAGMPRPVSAVATSCGSEINLIIINAQPGMNHDIIIGDGPWRGRKMRRVAVDETRKGVELVPVDFPDTPDFGAELVLSPYSLTVLRSET